MDADWLGLSGRTAVVTGGGSGIGRGIAVALSTAGCTVLVVDLDGAAAQQTVDLLPGKGVAAALDTTDRPAVRAAAEDLATTLGGADILVNNAGISGRGPLADLEPADWQRVLDVNVNGYLWCAQAFGAPMLERASGAVVNVTSICGFFPLPGAGGYSASKGAVKMLTRQLAVEWAGRGVRCNMVAPGLIRTPMTEAAYADPQLHERRRSIVPLRRIGAPNDIADAVLFLASERASYVTGQELLVDGGLGDTTMQQMSRLSD